MRNNFTTRFSLLVVALTMSLAVSAHGTHYSKATATADPTAAGKVYVGAGSGVKGSGSSATQDCGGSSSKDSHTYCFTAETTDNGYTFNGWYDENGTKKNGSSQYNENVSASSTNSNSPTTIKRTAKWTANEYTVTYKLNDDTVSAATINETSKKVKYADTYGTLQAPTRRWYTFDGWYTKATDGDKVTATTTVSTAKNHDLFAHWTLTPEKQTLSWGKSMIYQMARGQRQAISVSSNSGLTSFTYSSDNPDVIGVEGEYLVAKANGTANITVKQAGNTYFKPDSIKTKFTVLSKETPVFTPAGFSDQTACELKVGDAVTLNVANVSDGLNGDFKVIAAKNGGVMGVVRENNTITFSALHAGKDTITVAQKENDDIYGDTITYIFDVTRYQPVFALSKTALELEQTAQLTLENVDGATISFQPDDKVSYNGSTGVIKAIAVGPTVLNIVQAQTNSIAAKDTSITITVSKKTPTLTVKMGNKVQDNMSIALGNTVNVSFEKVSDASIEVSLESGDQYASYKNGVMTTAAVGSAVYRATLPETNTYQGKSVTFTLNVTANTNHLPITDRSYTVGSGEALDWSHKYETLSFLGIPEKLTFNYAYDYTPFKILSYNVGDPSLKCPDYLARLVDDDKEGSGNEHMIYVEESADNVHWTVKWTNDDATDKDSHPSGDIDLDPTTRYIRFHHSSNFKNYFTNIKITEKKYVKDPASSTLDFGTKDINSGKDSLETLIDWCNVAPMTVTCDNPRFTVTPSSFGDYMAYNNTEKIKVFFTHTNAIGMEEGNITIKNGTITKTIRVKAKTQKRQQTITWDKELVATGFALSLNERIPTDSTIKVIATATNGGHITFTSDKPEFVEVVNDTLLAVGIGTAKITALQVGDAEYDTVRSEKTFVVSLKQKQKILWDQNLYGLLTTDGTIKLTARATSGGPIVYSLDNDTVLQQMNDSVFRVLDEGKVRITARQNGFTDDEGVEWLEVEQDNFAVVRNPNSQCGGTALAVASLTLDGSKTKESYDLNGIPGETITFKAMHGVKKPAWGVTPSYSPLKVEQYATINNELNWYPIFEDVVGTSEGSYSNVTAKIDQTATQIRFSTLETGTEHTIKDINLKNKKFMESKTKTISQDVESNVIWSQEITVSHSDIDLMSISTKQGLLDLSATLLGKGCSDYGDDKFTVSYTPAQKDTTYRDTIVITDNKANPSTIVIPVELRSKGLNQSISGFELPTTCEATVDTIKFRAHADSNLPVEYVSTDSTIAYVNADSMLVILRSGIVTIKARQGGNEKYDAAPEIAKTITITKVATSITTAPAASEITYGQALGASDLTDGEGSVAGSFAWETPDATPASGTLPYTVVFTPTDSARYATANTLINVRVNKATPTITTYPTAGEITIAQALRDSELKDGAASVAGKFAWKNPDENRLKAGEYTRTVVFTPDNDNYNTVEIIVGFKVNNVYAQINEKPAITSENLVYGVTLVDVQMQGGSANVEGAFEWKDSTTVLQAGAHDYDALFVPTDLELYAKVPVSLSVTVAKATPSVTVWPTASELTYGEVLSESDLTGAQSSVTGEFKWISDASTILEAGDHTEAVRFTPNDANNYNTVDGEVVVKVNRANSTLTAPQAYDTLVYNGEAQALVAAGIAEGGELQYKLDDGEWSTTVPSAINGGNYTVYYKVIENANYNGIAEAIVNVAIKNTITWKDGNGETLKTDVLAYGATPAYTGATPLKTATDQYTYTFNGSWTPEIATVSADATYTAQFDATVNEYTITFENEDGTVLQSSDVKYGETPAYTGATPLKDATDQYSYTFNGWDPQVVAVTGSATYTAQFSSTVNKYTITWKDGDDATLKTEDVAYGSTPAYTGNTPTKAATAQYTYTFNDTWSPEIVPVTKAATYTAQFDATVNEYTITWLNDDESVIDTTMVAYGATPSHADPSKAATAQYTYSFAGWTPALAEVAGEAAYKAQFDSVVNQYIVVFNNYDGTELQNSKWNYGTTPAYNGETAPAKPATAQYTYTFTGWDAELAVVTAEATYTAQFDSVVNQYTVVFNNYDGTELQNSKWNYGATPAYNGETVPAKPATAQYTYTFTGWDAELAEVTAEATYTAQFDSTVNKYTITWLDDANQLIDETEVAYGVVPTHDAATKAATAQYTYSFTGWDPEIVAVTGAATYKAQFDSTVNKYTVQFVNGEEVLQSSEVEYGATPAYNGETDPAKAATAEWTYSFKGWNPAIAKVTEAAIYTAEFDSVRNAYTITWLDDANQLIDETVVEYGQTPTHADAEKATTAQYTYSFTGWTPALAEVTGVATYKAQFDSVVNQYTITFKNGEEVLQSTSVAYGETPAYEGAEPAKEATAEWTYSFKGWKPAIAEVTEAATYTAEFDSVRNAYTITWLDDANQLIDETVVEYGQTPSHADAEKAATAQYTYSFTGWDPEVATVTGVATYKAQFSSTVNEYTITFKNGETILQSSDVAYGETPEYAGATPTKEATEEYTYEFAGWDAELATVTGDATYTATFTANKRSYTITWLNDDESVIGTTEVEYGVVPTHADAEKAATAQYTYSFTGWTPALAEVTSDATYKAQFSSTVNEYTITFKNGETVLQSSDVAYGETPAYNGETPTKEADAQYSYTFNGWDAEIVAVTGNATYTATFAGTAKTYIVTLDADGGTINEGNVESYTFGEGATLPTDVTKTGYDFAGWYDGENQVTAIAADATGDKAFTAHWAAAGDTHYTVKHLQQNIADDEYTEVEAEDKTGATDAQTAAMAKNYEGFNAKVFAQGIIAADGSTVVEIYYDRQVFEIKFVVEGETVQTSDLRYGATVTAPAEPTKEADAQYTYTFAGWDAELATVTGNATYTATFTGTAKTYIVTLDADGGTINEGNVQSYTFGEGATLPTNVTKTGYDFAGWYDGENQVTAIAADATGDKAFTAHWAAAGDIHYTVKHFLQNLADNEYTEVEADREDKTGTTGEDTEAAAKDYTGFTAKNFAQAAIAADGSTVISIYYDRDLYVVTFVNGEETVDSDEYRYGATVVVPADPTKEATEAYTYTFAGWTPEVATIVTDHATYTATFDSTAVEVPEPEKQAQMIVWDEELPATLEVGDNTLQLQAYSSVWELNVYYISSDSTVAYVDKENYVVALKAGEVTITAHQDGNDTYKAAEPVAKTLTIKQKTIATDIDETEAQTKAIKVIRNDQVFIIRNGRTYTATGRLVE